MDNGNVTADVNVVPKLTNTKKGKPDMIYRNSPAFNLTEEEYKSYVNDSVVPTRIIEFWNDNQNIDVFMKYGKNVVFNVRKILKQTTGV